jgi:hypothetical protein
LNEGDLVEQNRQTDQDRHYQDSKQPVTFFHTVAIISFENEGEVNRLQRQKPRAVENLLKEILGIDPARQSPDGVWGRPERGQ